MDPITNLIAVGEQTEVRSMLTRLIDFFKKEQITVLFTSLTMADHAMEHNDLGVSSLIDTWILLQNLQQDAERNRSLYILKSRGMQHSNQVRPFTLSNKGIQIRQRQRNNGYSSAYAIAQLYADLGGKDQAFQWLNKAYQEHDWLLVGLKTDFLLDPLRPTVC